MRCMLFGLFVSNLVILLDLEEASSAWPEGAQRADFIDATTKRARLQVFEGSMQAGGMLHYKFLIGHSEIDAHRLFESA